MHRPIVASISPSWKRAAKQAPSATVQEWVDEAGYYTGIARIAPCFTLGSLISSPKTAAKLAGKRSLELYPTATVRCVCSPEPV